MENFKIVELLNSFETKQMIPVKVELRNKLDALRDMVKNANTSEHEIKSAKLEKFM